MNDLDRIRQSNGGCLISTGCNTFFPLQASDLLIYANSGKSAYHAMTMSLRRTVSNGWGYDFNYTWSHAIDNGSGSEGSANSGTSGGGPTNIPNAFCSICGMGPADL